MRKKTMTVTVKMPEDMLEKLDNIMKKTGLSRSEIIRAAVEYFLEALEEVSRDKESAQKLSRLQSS